MVTVLKRSTASFFCENSPLGGGVVRSLGVGGSTPRDRPLGSADATKGRIYKALARSFDPVGVRARRCALWDVADISGTFAAVSGDYGEGAAGGPTPHVTPT
jgi:hypothetical protein